MTEPDLHHDIPAAPADELVLHLRLAFEALHQLQHTALSIQCRGCDPDGTRTEDVRQEALALHDVDVIDADMLLSAAADTRHTLLGILIPPCTHNHDEED